MTNGITAEGLSKFYGKKQIIRQVSLSIDEGEIFGLVGPSGGGKTTLVKMIGGILKADCGSVKVLDHNMPSFAAMQHIGYMAQAAAVYPVLTGRENLRFFGQLYGLKKDILEERIQHTAALTDLTDDLDRKAAEYSGGMQQRLSLACALIANPKVLLLDEPTVGIDPVLRESIWAELNSLAQDGLTVLITTHVMDEAMKCGRLAMIYEGQVLTCGTPQQVMAEAGTDNLEAAFVTLERRAEHANKSAR